MIDNKEKLLTLIVAMIITTLLIATSIGIMLIYDWLTGYTNTSSDWAIIFLGCWSITLLNQWYRELREG